jgi:hypothetical protein
MKESVKKKWLQALRSGKYKQTTACLQDEAGFCCLGVLCDLYAKETKAASWQYDENGSIEVFNTGSVRGPLGGRYDAYPPTAVYTWAGLHHSTAKRLAVINDESCSFDPSADYIEERL